RDLGSTNGTSVNGQRIDGPTTVGEDDEIGFGDQRFRLRLEREPEPPPPEPAPVTEAPERLVDPTVAIRVAPEGIDLLVQVAGAGAGTSYPLTGDTITIGRDPRNDVVVADPKVSASHAHIQHWLDGGPVVEDRGSTNGTTVNEAPLEGAHRLADDDLIEVGDTAFQFKRFALRGDAS